MSAATPLSRTQPLGELLVARGIIGPDQLEIALTEQQRNGQMLGKLLVQLGFITENTLRDVLGESFAEQSIDLAHTITDAAALALVPKALAQRLKVYPVAWEAEQSTLVLAMADPTDIVALDQVRGRIGASRKVRPVLAGETEVLNAIQQTYGFELSIDGILREIETGNIDIKSLQDGVAEYSHPLVRLIDALLVDAVNRGASDIHFEPEEFFLRIRYRIDGVLRQIRSLHKMYWPGMVVRMKVMSDMNIAEMRAPQDGHISLSIGGRVVDFRVAAQPTVHGENFVLRVLDRMKGIVPLPKLGMNPHNEKLIRLMMARPHGIILITGPTGSGKTTTLYSILNEVNSEKINIMTLEDPVEYPMPMIRQSSVNLAAKMDFATGIRSMMRQDPDIILVGEVRDNDTAEMAFRAAMTGHQVYTTLHTNSAAGAFPRLRDIGVDPELMAENIIGVVAQRLVRKLCPHCRRSRRATVAELELLGQPLDRDIELYEPRGCERCDHTGYKGRVAVMEVLRFTRELDELLATGATAGALERAARAVGFRDLVEDGVERVLSGVTSLAEVSRVLDLTSRVR